LADQKELNITLGYRVENESSNLFYVLNRGLLEKRPGLGIHNL